MFGDIEAHAVHELDGSNRHTEAHGCLIDVDQGDPFGGKRHGFTHVGGEDAIDDEARGTHALEREFADTLGEGEADIHGVLLGVFAADDLDKRQHGDRVEEVQPDKAARLVQHGAKILELDTRCVRGDERLGLLHRLQLPVELLLGLEILEDSLDDEVRPGDAVARNVRLQACRGRCPRRLITHLLVEQLPRALHGRGDILLFAILQGHGVAAQRAPGRDVAAHDAGADNMHVLDFLVGLVALFLELALQEEYANQVARRIGQHDAAEALGLGIVTRLR